MGREGSLLQGLLPSSFCPLGTHAGELALGLCLPCWGQKTMRPAQPFPSFEKGKEK